MQLRLTPALSPFGLTVDLELNEADVKAAFPSEGESPEADGLYYDIWGPGRIGLNESELMDRVAKVVAAALSGAATAMKFTAGTAVPKET